MEQCTITEDKGLFKAEIKTIREFINIDNFWYEKEMIQVTSFENIDIKTLLENISNIIEKYDEALLADIKITEDKLGTNYILNINAFNKVEDEKIIKELSHQLYQYKYADLDSN